MDDFISREAAIEAARRAERDSNYDGRKFDAECVECAIDFIPAADVVEVRHGEWIIQNSLVNGVLLDENEVFACSACQEQRTRRKYNYCPNCGARMDGDGE